MDVFNIVVGFFGIIGAIATVYSLYRERQASQPVGQNKNNLLIPQQLVNARAKKRKRKIYLIALFISIFIFFASSIIFSVRLLAFHNNGSPTHTTISTRTPVTKTPGSTPTTIISPSTFDAEFPANIKGPAIVEWADGGCGIFKLNAGEQFNWQNDGHYWLYPNQASLDAFFPGHLKDYQKKNPPSCIVGRPKQP